MANFLNIFIVFSLILTPSSVNAMKIYVVVEDKSTSPSTPIVSIESINNNSFKNFVSGVISILDSKFDDQVKIVQSPFASNEKTLKFIRIPLISSGDNIISYSRFTSPNENCHISSPWTEITINHSDKQQIYGEIFWNENQILRDQITLSIGTPLQYAPLRSMERSKFENFSGLYEQILANHENSQKENTELNNTIPTDLLWLFENSPQSTRGPFSNGAVGKIKIITESSIDLYIHIIGKIMEGCAVDNLELQLDDRGFTKLLKSYPSQEGNTSQP